MQKDIDAIVLGNNNIHGKLQKLKELFKETHVEFFSDFDDTITANDNLFYSKLKFYKWIYKKIDFGLLLKKFRLNDLFAKSLRQRSATKIVVLSRNNHDFIKYFIAHTKALFHQTWIEILWWVWSTEGFKINSQDKINMMPVGSLLFTDVFEYKKLREHKKVICIEEYNKTKVRSKIVLKSIYFCKSMIIW